jgi:cellular nucleic acid-binding protein
MLSLSLSQAQGQAGNAAAAPGPAASTSGPLASPLASQGPAISQLSQQGSPGCHRCGHVEHTTSQCPTPAGACLSCGQQGHLAIDCPARAARSLGAPTATPGCGSQGLQALLLRPSPCASQQSGAITPRAGPAVPSAHLGTPLSSRPQPGSQSQDVCFSCGQQGHWSKYCPNRSGPGGSRASQGPASTTCFTCGQVGHWSKDCPNRSQKRSACYICGDSSHWASKCPRK